MSTPTPNLQPAQTHWLRRRVDGLLLRFDFLNMRHDRRTASMVPANRSFPSYVAVTFPPQHVMEQAFFAEQKNLTPPEPDTSDPDNPPPQDNPIPPPVGARLAEESRLVFVLPGRSRGVPLTVASLLGWVAWSPSLVDSAVEPGQVPPGSQPTLAHPGEHQSSIELPWRLVLSPHLEVGLGTRRSAGHPRWSH